MAMNKKETEAFSGLARKFRLRAHMANPVLHEPTPLTPLAPNDKAIGFRILGYKTEWRIEKGRFDGVLYWIPDNGTVATRLDDNLGKHKVFATEKDAMLAIYCRIRDEAAEAMLRWWDQMDNPEEHQDGD